MKRLAIILAGVLVLGTAAIADNYPGGCVTRLKGLTAQQIEKINQLEDQHQKVMDQLRTERRSTANWMEKDKTLAKMLNQKDKHHTQLKEVLTAEQWAEYEALHQNSAQYGNGRYAVNNSRNNGNGHGNVKGNGHRSCNWNSRGHGNNNNATGRFYNQGWQNDTRCTRPSHTSNIDTSLYQKDNFNIVEL